MVRNYRTVSSKFHTTLPNLGCFHALESMTWIISKAARPPHGPFAGVGTIDHDVLTNKVRSRLQVPGGRVNRDNSNPSEARTLTPQILTFSQFTPSQSLHRHRFHHTHLLFFQHSILKATCVSSWRLLFPHFFSPIGSPPNAPLGRRRRSMATGIARK